MMMAYICHLDKELFINYRLCEGESDGDLFF